MAYTSSPALRARHKSSRAAANPYYGYDYNPSWPSILSVAHDTLAGENLYVIVDRPCVLTGIGLPLIVHGSGGETLAIVAAAMVLPTKFQVTLSDAVPAGAAWQWAGGAAQLVDAVTGHAPNAGHGTCADVPGPYVPPPPPSPPSLLSARFDSMLLRLTLWFDRNVDSSSADVAAFVVHDGRDTHASYVGSGPVGLVSGSAIEVSLASTGAYEGLGATLIVGAANGVVAQDGDAPWAGVAGDALPWPVFPPAT
ncbi:MAG TPA: hypothetical protein VEA69_05570, partial [Tepidisphaeraceae bacterium]|nr:hypothetical protein [Tepidisphaeraceae bacterium]